MPLSLLTRLRFAIALVRANQLAGSKEYDEAINVLAKTFSGRSGDIDLERLPLLAKVRYLSLCYKSRKLEEATRALTSAIDDLDRGTDRYRKTPLSSADREYLYFYCRWLACLFPPGSAAFQAALTMGGSYAALDFPATSRLLKSVFPITAEAGRHVDAFIEANMPPTPLV